MNETTDENGALAPPWARVAVFAAAFTAGGVAVGAAVVTGRLNGFGSMPLGAAAAVLAVGLAGAASVLEVRRARGTGLRRWAFGLAVALALVLAGWLWTTVVLMGAVAESQLAGVERAAACWELVEDGAEEVVET